MGFWEIKDVVRDVKIYSVSRCEWMPARLNTPLRNGDIIAVFSGARVILEENGRSRKLLKERTAYQVGGKSFPLNYIYRAAILRQNIKPPFGLMLRSNNSSRLDIIKKHFIKKNNTGYFRKPPTVKKQTVPESTPIPEVKSGETSNELAAPSYTAFKMKCTYCEKPPRNSNFICGNHRAGNNMGKEDDGTFIKTPFYESLDEAAMTAAKIILRHVDKDESININERDEYCISIYGGNIQTNDGQTKEIFCLTSTKRGDTQQVFSDYALDPNTQLPNGYKEHRFVADVHSHPVTGVQEFSIEDYMLALGFRHTNMEPADKFGKHVKYLLRNRNELLKFTPPIIPGASNEQSNIAAARVMAVFMAVCHNNMTDNSLLWPRNNIKSQSWKNLQYIYNEITKITGFNKCKDIVTELAGLELAAYKILDKKIADGVFEGTAEEAAQQHWMDGIPQIRTRCLKTNFHKDIITDFGAKLQKARIISNPSAQNWGLTKEWWEKWGADNWKPF